MNARKFNTHMKNAHHLWAAKVLGTEVNPGIGPDLMDSARNLGIEIKFSLTANSWTVLEYQMNYNNGRTCYWGLGVYKLNRPISSIRTTSPKELEDYVTKRELYIIGWGWMKQFPPHRTQGQTDRSSWENTLRYPKFRDIPKIIASHRVEKGIIHFTEGVESGLFRN
jgi:hypothetical protein